MPDIQLPGGGEYRAPTPSEMLLQNIAEQLNHLQVAVNTLCGQVDMGLRLASGQHSKHEVKVRFEEHDKQVRIAQAKLAQPAANDPALD